MDLTVINCGEERCTPGHSYGPAVRKGYLFHYIISGSGVFFAGGRRHALHAGQGFLIYPGQVTTYTADAEHPWHYVWLGFRGEEAAALIAATGITEAAPYFTTRSGAAVTACIRQIYRDIAGLSNSAAGALAAAGGVLRFIALISPADARPVSAAVTYYEKAMWYIRAHLENGVTVEQVADFVGLSRSQLFRACKEAAGQSPNAVIAHARASMARGMLSNSALTLTQIALSCGYASAAHFCTAFRRDCGLTPTEYRCGRQEAADPGRRV